MADLKTLVDGWVGKGLISPEQGATILAEHSSPLPVTMPPGRLVTEALAYVGGVLVLLAATLIASIYWPSLGPAGRSALTGAATAFVLGAGILAPQAMGAAARVRLRAVLWALAVLLCGIWAGITLDALHWKQEWSLPVATGCALVLAIFLWGYQKTALQLSVLGLSLAVTAASAAALLPRDDGATIGLAVFGSGLPWLALAWGAILVPQRVAYLLGGVALVFGSLLTAQTGWGLTLASVTVAALVTVAVLLRDLWLLGVGAVGVLVTVPLIVDRFFSGQLGAALALLSAGAMLIVLALVTARRRGTRTPAAATVKPWLPAAISPWLAAAAAAGLALAAVPFVLLSGGAISW